MTDQIELLPCPFCAGPPVPIIRDAITGVVDPVCDDYGEDGLDAEAFVFCHECGADGPIEEDVIYDRADYFALEAKAVRLWQERDARHIALFDAGKSEGLNLYPRIPVGQRA